MQFLTVFLHACVFVSSVHLCVFASAEEEEEDMPSDGEDNDDEDEETDSEDEDAGSEIEDAGSDEDEEATSDEEGDSDDEGDDSEDEEGGKRRRDNRPKQKWQDDATEGRTLFVRYVCGHMLLTYGSALSCI